MSRWWPDLGSLPQKLIHGGKVRPQRTLKCFGYRVHFIPVSLVGPVRFFNGSTCSLLIVGLEGCIFFQARDLYGAKAPVHDLAGLQRRVQNHLGMNSDWIFVVEIQNYPLIRLGQRSDGDPEVRAGLLGLAAQKIDVR